MALLGQASGGWTESSSALRILHVGIRNTVGVLTTDSFTQTNPVAISTTSCFPTDVAGFSSSTLGVLGGSVAYTRPDGGANEIGGPPNTGAGANAAAVTGVNDCRPLGVFINTAVGNAYENTPGPASGKGPYVSGQGTYANSLYESQSVVAATIGNDLTYTTGEYLYGSVNGYLTNEGGGVAGDGEYLSQLPAGAETLVLAILKMPADATQAEIVYDQRI